jgi:hypothetical protein
MRKIKENAAENCANMQSGINLRRFIYLTCFAGLGLFFSGCSTGYVATRPVYVEAARPATPGNGYVWVNNDWAYNRQSKVYIQNNGNWQKQRPHKKFVGGHWEASPRGNYWVSSHWQRN